MVAEFAINANPRPSLGGRCPIEIETGRVPNMPLDALQQFGMVVVVLRLRGSRWDAPTRDYWWWGVMKSGPIVYPARAHSMPGTRP